MEGNLPVSAKCLHCDKTCGSVLRLQDWRCLWCRAAIHTQCRPSVEVKCPLGPSKVSVVPPTSLHSVGIDEAWDVVKPQGSFSPLLVFGELNWLANQSNKSKLNCRFFLRQWILNPVTIKASNFCDASSNCWIQPKCLIWFRQAHNWVYVYFAISIRFAY